MPSNDPRDESDTPPATAKQSRTPSSSAIAAAADNHPSAFCDYCGSTGHKEDECPHHRDDAADENSSSSNSEEEGEGEEEEEQSEGEEDM